MYVYVIWICRESKLLLRTLPHWHPSHNRISLGALSHCRDACRCVVALPCYIALSHYHIIELSRGILSQYAIRCMSLRCRIFELLHCHTIASCSETAAQSPLLANSERHSALLGVWLSHNCIVAWCFVALPCYVLLRYQVVHCQPVLYFVDNFLSGNFNVQTQSCINYFSKFES